MKTIILSDIGGQLDLFEKILARLNITDTVPPDMKVIQIGDVVRRHTDFFHENMILLEKVENIKGNWITLFGNHEANAVFGSKLPHWTSDHYYSKEVITKLNKMFNDGFFKIAENVSINNQDTLVTHAGLGFEMWKDLGEPTVKETLKLIDFSHTDMRRTDDPAKKIANLPDYLPACYQEIVFPTKEKKPKFGVLDFPINPKISLAK